MGAYDSIQIPVSGQPISSSLYGVRVRDAILDLDRRVSSYDASTGVGKALSTTNQSLNTTTETVALTIAGFTFRAGYAYECTMRMGIRSSVAGTLVNMRIRKTNAAGTDWGEYYRFEGKGPGGGQTMSCLGTIYLLNNTGTDVTTDVALTAQSSLAATDAIVMVGLTASPRFFTVRPAGFAIDYAGMGIGVS